MAHVNPIQIQKYLKGVDYPASKQALLDKAKSMGADDNICQSLEQLPDEDFQTPADVSQAFGRLPDDAGGGREQAGAARHAGSRKQAAKGGRKEPAAGQRRHTGGNEFLIQAMQDSMAEIQICEMAIEKTQNPDMRQFAQSMIDEHGRMGRELEKLAADKQLEIPRTVRPEQQMTVDELSALEGRDFEQRWIQYNIDVHERDIKVFQHYASEESDRDIATISKQHGDTLAKHLKAAHEVGKKLAKP